MIYSSVSGSHVYWTSAVDSFFSIISNLISSTILFRIPEFMSALSMEFKN